MSDISYEKLIGKCRDAAIGDYNWEVLLADICTWVGGDKAMMMGSHDSGPYSNTLTFNHDPVMATKYNNDYNFEDPRLALSKLTRPGDCRTGQQYLCNKEIVNTEYYNEITLKADVMDSVHSVLIDNLEFGRHAISVQRSFKGEFFDEKSLIKMRALLPHMSRAFADSLRIASKSGEKVKGQDSASFLIDANFRLRCLGNNPSDVIKYCDKLSWHADRLYFDSGALMEAFKICISSAGQGKSQTFQVRDSQSKYLKFSFSPYPENLEWADTGGSFIFLQIYRQINQIEDLLQVYMRTFGLTESENRVLAALLEHHNTRIVAQSLKIGYETLRWHLKNILGKTGYNNKERLLQSIRERDLTHIL